MTPSQDLRAMTAHLSTLLSALATSRLAQVGDDGLIAAAIEYAMLELDDLRGDIEGQRARHRDEQGLLYYPDDDALEAKEAITKAAAACADYVVTKGRWVRKPYSPVFPLAAE